MREVNARVQCEGLAMLGEERGGSGGSEDLMRLVEEFGSVYSKEIENVGKSKVTRCAREGGGDRLDVRLDEEMQEEVEIFKYLGSHVALNGKVNVEVGHRVKEANKCIGGMKSMLCNSSGDACKKQVV